VRTTTYCVHCVWERESVIIFSSTLNDWSTISHMRRLSDKEAWDKAWLLWNVNRLQRKPVKDYKNTNGEKKREKKREDGNVSSLLVWVHSSVARINHDHPTIADKQLRLICWCCCWISFPWSYRCVPRTVRLKFKDSIQERPRQEEQAWQQRQVEEEQELGQVQGGIQEQRRQEQEQLA